MNNLERQRSALRLLLGVCRETATAFEGDHVIDPMLRADLNGVIALSESELEQLNARITASESAPASSLGRANGG
jgi:hypothetical protein